MPSGRSDIDIAYQEKIWQLMVDFDLAHRPLEVYRRLHEWANMKHSSRSSFPDLVTDQSWDQPPSYKTVQRYVGRFRHNAPIPAARIREFHYFNDMDTIGWHHSSPSLGCLRFYLSYYGVRPPVGLVQWFSRMSAAMLFNSFETKEFNVQSRRVGLYSEVCWFRELAAGFGKPVSGDVTLLELRLAWKYLGSENHMERYEDVAKSQGIGPHDTLMLVDKVHKRLMTEMPVLMEVLPKSTYK